MISGREALLQIVGAAHGEQGALSQLDAKLDGLSRELMELQQRRAELYRDLAKIRVDRLDDDPLQGQLDAAEHQALSLLEQRTRAQEALERELGAAAERRDALEQERRAQAQAVEQASARIDEAEAATQARLDTEPDYRAQRERAREAERVAMHAEEKAAASEQEQSEKGVSYRGDPLFMYLWNRQFGTSGYKGSGLFRWLDGKVARLIGYDDARLNFSRLQEIPARLREHAQTVRAQSDAEFAKLRMLDEAAQAADGVPALVKAKDAEQERLDDLDARLGEAETALHELMQRKSVFAAGEDEHMRKAIDHLAAAFAREDLAELRRDALATPFPDDDRIVDQLLDDEQAQRRLSFTIENLKQTRTKHLQKLEDLARLERDFKRGRMDRSGSGFADGAMIAMMIANFVNGMLDREALMRVLEEQVRYQPRRADPTFGSGGFGRGTPWGGGDSFGGRGGFGRGGFGGGFRGGGSSGGFRTGGGF